MAVICRRNNIGVVPSPPSTPHPSCEPFLLKKSDLTAILNSTTEKCEVKWSKDGKEVLAYMEAQKVVGFDLEFHNADSFDG